MLYLKKVVTAVALLFGHLPVECAGGVAKHRAKTVESGRLEGKRKLDEATRAWLPAFAEGGNRDQFRKHWDNYAASPTVDGWEKLTESFTDTYNVKRNQTRRRSRAEEDDMKRLLQVDAIVDPPEFRPLSANSNLMSVPCVRFSAQGYDLTQTVTIPEGTCVEVDVGGRLHFENGLDIRGRLAFFGNINELLVVRSKFIFVQGILTIRNNDNIPTTNNNFLRFVLEGEDDVFLTPHSDNAHLCPEPDSCKVGSKPFVVAGGKLDVVAFPTSSTSCATWVNPESSKTAALRSPKKAVETFQEAPPSCSSDSVVVMYNNFNDGTTQGWGVRGGNIGTLSVETEGSHDGSPYLSLTNREENWVGFNVLVPTGCFVPDVPYLVQTRFRMTSTTSSGSLCSQNDENCPGMGFSWQLTSNDPDGGEYGSMWITSYNQDRVAADGEWFDMHATIMFSEEEALTNEYLWFELDLGGGPEVSIDVAIDDFVLQRFPPAFFSESCEELIPNGDLQFTTLADTHPFPFELQWNNLVTVQTEESNRYLKIANRASRWNLLHHHINTDCITAGSTYQFSFRHRRLTTDPGYLRVHLDVKDKDDNYNWQFVVDCPPATTTSGWVSCSSLITFTQDHVRAKELQIGIEEETDEEENFPDIDLDDLHLTFVSGPMESLTLPAARVRCWGPGAEVLLTSSVISHEFSSVVTIESIDHSTGEVTFVQKDIVAPPTLAETSDYPIEVALLSRNVVVQSAVTDNKKRGGHLMVFFTPREVQTLQGVEFRSMGQQGVRGRYPVHIHISRDMTNSVVSKNVIRDSNQRCIVVHGSDSLEVSENVAFNTHGHCFMCEEGGERDNMFISNLGASTLRAEDLISDMDTDDNPATFWSPSPRNHWKFNVAAGSDNSGFWFENHGDVFGETALLFRDTNTFEVPLLSFEGNVAHSNGCHGIQTYPNGFFPITRARFVNSKSYRNNHAGLFYHNSENFYVEGGLFADNEIQIQIHRADDVKVEGVRIVGVSDEAQKELERNLDSDNNRICPSDWRTVYGISIHSYVMNPDLPGPTMTNVQFSKLGDAETGCTDSSALFIHEDEIRDNHFDSRTVFENVNFSGSSSIINACDVTAAGVNDIFLEDSDGSLIPGGAGFLVSDNEQMTGFIGNVCAPFGDSCLQSCPGVCLRTIEFNFDHTQRGDLKLRVQKDGKTVIMPSLDGYVSQWQQHSENFHGRLSATLPGGHYNIAIVDSSNAPTWPLYVATKEGMAPECSGGAVTFDLVEPSASCSELASNGDVETGSLEFWKHLWSGIDLYTPGKDSGFAAASGSFGNSNIGQHLDSRCMTLGAAFEVEASVKSVNKKGVSVECNTKKNPDCPRATLKIIAGPDEEEEEYYESAGWLVVSASDDEWGTVHGAFKVTQRLVDAERIFLYLEDGPARLVADNLSIRSINLSSAPFIMNGDFEGGDSRFWTRGWNNEDNLAIVSPGAAGSSFALRTVQRKESWEGLIYPVVGMSLVTGQEYEFKAKYKLVKSKNGKPVSCNPNVQWDKKSCPLLTVIRDDSYEHFFFALSPVNKKAWNDMRGTFTATSEDASADYLALKIEGVKKKVDIVIDNVSLTPV